MATSREPAAGPHGAQTLTRGLTALGKLAERPYGMTIQELSDALNVHRSVGYRLLQALAELNYAVRGRDGRYRVGSRVLFVANSYQASLRSLVEPVLQEAARELGCSISLLVEEGAEAVALLVLQSGSGSLQLAFREGSRHLLDRGAAGHALLSTRSPSPSDADAVIAARADGYALTFGEVEPGIYGLAVPIDAPAVPMAMCLNLISHRRDLVEAGRERLIRAAKEVAALL